MNRARLKYSTKDIVALFYLFIAIFAAILFYIDTMLNHDSSWYLVATTEWLNGAVLYRDILENNPPLAFYLTVPAVLLSRATGMTAENAFLLTVFAAIFASLIWTHRLLQKAYLISHPNRLIMLAAAYLALCVTPVSDFGQRDHLTVIFVLPYVILTAFRSKVGRQERVAIGLAAAFGIALKPHFIVLPIALAVVSAYQRRQFSMIFSAQHASIILAGALYIAFVAIVHYEYFELIVPMARLVYGAYSVPLLAIIPVSVFVVISFLITVVLAGKFEKQEQYSIIILLITLFSFIISYFLQYKGWRYHTIPIYSFLLIATTWVFIVSSGRLRSNRRLAMFFVLTLPTAVAVFAFHIAAGPYFNGNVARFTPFLSRDGMPLRFVALDTRVSVSFPLANLTGATLATHFSAPWIIPGAVRQLTLGAPSADQRERLEQTLEFARQTITADIVTCRPDIVLINVDEAKPYFGEARFDYLEFLAQSERFQTVWRDYRFVERIGGIEIWEKMGQSQRGNREQHSTGLTDLSPIHMFATDPICASTA